MNIDPADLRKSFDKFLAAPAGKTWLENVGQPGWLLLIASAVIAFIGFLQLFTIVWIPSGLRWLLAGITFRPYRESVRKHVEANIDRLQIIPACGIIFGPLGRSLVLGSFSPIELIELEGLSLVFGNLYTNGSADERDAEIVKILKNDIYVEYRRRRVPEPYNKGRDLFLFDTEIADEECRSEIGGKPTIKAILALAATSGETGIHLQIPWAAVDQVLDQSGSDDDAGAKSKTKKLRRVGQTSADVEESENPLAESFVEHLEQLGTVDPNPIQETIQGHPPLKIHIVSDESDDKYLITEGMSSRPMTVPPGGEEYQYSELSIFLRDNWPLDAASLKDDRYRWPIRWLRKIARYPHQNQTWLGGRYAIIANGEPPAPLGPDTKLTCLLVIANPKDFGQWIREDGETVVFYDVLPLYTEERDFEKQHGIAALMRKFQAYGISPWLNPNRVNTALLTDEEEAEIDAKRHQRLAESESGADTYALAADRADDWDDELETTPEDADWLDEDDGPRSTQRSDRVARKVTSRSIRQRDDSRPWWKEFLASAGGLLGVVALGSLAALIYPPVAAWMLAAFVLGSIVLIGASWILGFRHALQHDKLAAALFLFPWYFIKYGMRNLPETRPSMTALGLFMVWISAPFLIAMPIGIMAKWLPPNNPVAQGANGIPKPVDFNPPPAIPEAKPADPNALPVSIWRGKRDGKTFTTVRWSDGTVGSMVRPSLSMAVPTADDLRRRDELSRKLRDQRDQVGAVIIADVKGSEMELIYGGQDGIYTLDSLPDAAAVHAGLVKIDQTAKVKITIVAKQTDFPMIEQNGIISLKKGPFAWEGYKIEAATPDDVTKAQATAVPATSAKTPP